MCAQRSFTSFLPHNKYTLMFLWVNRDSEHSLTLYLRYSKPAFSSCRCEILRFTALPSLPASYLRNTLGLFQQDHRTGGCHGSHYRPFSHRIGGSMWLSATKTPLIRRGKVPSFFPRCVLWKVIHNPPAFYPRNYAYLSTLRCPLFHEAPACYP